MMEKKNPPMFSFPAVCQPAMGGLRSEWGGPIGWVDGDGGGLEREPKGLLPSLLSSVAPAAGQGWLAFCSLVIRLTVDRPSGQPSLRVT